MKALKKIPSLRGGNDESRAKQLGVAVRDAQEGARRIAICGFLIEAIASELEHGELGPWINAHQTEIGAKRRAIFSWRQFSQSLLRAAGIEKCTTVHFSLSFGACLSLPFDKLPPEAKEVREKMDALLEGRTYRQLFLAFKQAEEIGDELVTKRGGHHYDHAVKGRGHTGPTAQPIDYQAEHSLWPAWAKFRDYWRDGVWVGLPRSYQKEIDDALADMRRQLKEALK